MQPNLAYMPIFRLRQEEKKVLVTFNFGASIIPCIEIIKLRERALPKPKKGAMPKPEKSFEEIYLPILKAVKSERIFVDLPVHMQQPRNIKKEVLEFLTTVVSDRTTRTEYMLKLAEVADKIIPVISTYSQRTNEINSIKFQEADLRPTFKKLCFRTFPKTFNSDMAQIQEVAKSSDYLIVDLEETKADTSEEDVIDIMETLQDFDKCPVIMVRNVVSNSIRNAELEHGQKISEIHGGLIKNYKSLHANAFGDYVGIKKDLVTNGGAISPGFIFYDPLNNCYFGYRGDRYKNSAGKMEGRLSDIADIIIPAVLKSDAVAKMALSAVPYLSEDNIGWKIINAIHAEIESGQNQAKLKRISMEHYLHCIKSNINVGHYDN